VDFLEVTKDVCKFPSFFNAPLYRRILLLFGKTHPSSTSSNNDDTTKPTESTTELTYAMFQNYWIQEMEPYDEQERFFRLVKKPSREYITRDDFLPFIEELLMSHPGLEFLSNHAEFQGT
jgi:serine/threonine-protein phosphatase 2A regulatory subunit B''